MTSCEIRECFLAFFNNNGHDIVESCSLVPHDDPTLLFINAGMNQFKKVFLGQQKVNYVRATSSQRCVRAGGKHNDLENVGYTARHHTFFEMLGNFSFGDYFKREAIHYAWEFLTRELLIPEDKLWVTVFHDDKESENIWLKDINIDPKRFSRLGEADNFWSMADTGPCGPCSEIFYDHGSSVAGGPPGSSDEDGDRYVEIWNMVFMQYNRFGSGELVALPTPSIDTGMGLERIAAVMQGVKNNYDIDIFKHILKSAANILSCSDITKPSLRAIADHIRSCAFLIADGVDPLNEGRGYVLRRILRRACRHGYTLGVQEPFLYKLVPALIESMGAAANVVKMEQERVTQVIKEEEQRFSVTLGNGLKILSNDIDNLESRQITGKTIFTLYDTYGFPVDLTQDIARERGYALDMEGYTLCMEQQKQMARGANKFKQYCNQQIVIDGVTTFTGYISFNETSKIIALVQNNELVQSVNEDFACEVVIEKTPFYAESGGQIGDSGVIQLDNGTSFLVENTYKNGSHYMHQGHVKSGRLNVGDMVVAKVNEHLRQSIECNHTATHLLHAALRELLGSHVKQKGSLVEHGFLRFDFSHDKSLGLKQISHIETVINNKIRENSKVKTEIMSIKEAKEKGAVALFGEKYEDKVRVLSIGNDGFSIELCGGTHVERTGDIGSFIITRESAVASGVRRIEALTADKARQWWTEQNKYLHESASLLNTDKWKVKNKIEVLLNKQESLEKTIRKLKKQLVINKAEGMLSDSVKLGQGVHALVQTLEDVEAADLRELVDNLKNKLGRSVVVLATIKEDKVAFVVGVSKDLTSLVNAGDLVKMIALKLDGKGGGRADFAQGGGAKTSALPDALQDALVFLTKKVSD